MSFVGSSQAKFGEKDPSSPAKYLAEHCAPKHSRYRHTMRDHLVLASRDSLAMLTTKHSLLVFALIREVEEVSRKAPKQLYEGRFVTGRRRPDDSATRTKNSLSTSPN